MHGAVAVGPMPEIEQHRLEREVHLFQGRQMLRRHLEITFSLLGRLLLATQEARLLLLHVMCLIDRASAFFCCFEMTTALSNSALHEWAMTEQICLCASLLIKSAIACACCM